MYDPRQWLVRRAPRPWAWLGLLLLGLAVYRFSLIGSGHFFWPDEWCHDLAFPLIDCFLAGEYFNCVSRLFVQLARPGLVIVAAVPALVQRLVGSLCDIDPSALRFYDAAAAFNVVVTLGVTVCVFGVARIWTRSSWYALLAAAVYSLLANTHIYIRHLLPYHHALLPMLAALWMVSSAERRRRRSVRGVAVAGLLVGFGFAIYPGHYLLAGIVGAVVLITYRHRFRATVAFAAAGAAVLCGFELLARSVGVSYFAQIAETRSRGAQWASAPWNEDWAREGYVFAWHYLSQVEGLIGIALLVLFLACCVFFAFRPGIPLPACARVAVVGGLVAYLYQGTMSVCFCQTVLFGRYLTTYLPLLVCGAVIAVRCIPVARGRRLAAGGLAAMSAVSFAAFARDYATAIYPEDLFREVMAERGIDVPRIREIDSSNPMFTMVVDGLPDGMPPTVVSHEDARRSTARFLAVNFKGMSFHPIQYGEFVPPDGYTLVASAVHPNAFPATGFEAFPPSVRRRLTERRFTMRLYERRPPGGSASGRGDR